jgi:DNA-binding NtrC family response regulator
MVSPGLLFRAGWDAGPFVPVWACLCAMEALMARILCVDDDPLILKSYDRIVARSGHSTIQAKNAAEALHYLEREEVDLIISDYQLPGIDGLELLGMLRADRYSMPVIMVTAYGGVDHAMQALRAGAEDYLLKPFDPTELLHRIDRAVEGVRMRQELEQLRREVAAERSDRHLLGKSPAMRRVHELIAAVAQSRSTALIQGESGTGKELIARALHEQSDRRRNPFVQINCAALPEGLIESTLFGHEKGAFTGAIRRTEGAFERANGGTLLLDEVTEMRFDLQAKLLRVLQEREFERVGGSATIKVDVRVIATSNRNLEAEVEAGTFRRDLFYRLNVVPINVPPLRERLSDVPLLASHFATRAAAESGKTIEAIAPAAIDLLQRYSWPGNVRELQHVVERAVVLSAKPILDVDAFDTVNKAVSTERRPSLDSVRSLDAETGRSYAIALPTLNLREADEALIQEALRVSNNNRTHAAALLGIGVRSLRKKLNAPGTEEEAETSEVAE